MKAKRNIGITMILLGLLLIAAALWIVWGNLAQSGQAARSAQAALEVLRPPLPTEQTQGQTESVPELPEYIRNPDMPMPRVETDGHSYIGVVDIPALGLSLPVLGDWSYPLLKIAPCRYTGSVYKKDMILMAHNFPSHFGKLSSLSIDDEVYFTDTQGNVFAYAVTEVESLDGDAAEALQGGQWDLTLFTCTVGGQSRVTVRCQSTNMP